MYAEFSLLSQDDITDRTIQLHRGSAESCRIRFLNSGSLRWTLIGNDTTIARSLTLTNTNINKVAIRYNSAYASIWINGSLADTANNGMTYTGLDELAFDGFHSKTKALAVYKEALTDANLRSLTYPNPVATTFDLDFDTITEQFTFTRGSEATFVNAQGLIESTASNDAPRIDYSTGAKAFLLEPQSTNLITYSESFSNSYWTKSGASVVSGFVSPDGTNNAYKLVEDSASSRHFINSSTIITPDTVYSASLFVKANGRNKIAFRENSITGNYASFNLSNGTVISTNGVSASIEPKSNGWYRINCQIASGNSYVLGIELLSDSYTSGDPYSNPYQGNGSSGVYIWGAQVEQQSYATSYIPTSGASATRNQELCNNATPVINSEEGTLYAEISALADDGTSKPITISDDNSE